MRNKKQPIFIMEGVDCTGKTTLREALHRATNFKYLIIDRGPASNYVYNKLFERRCSSNHRLDNAFKDMKEFNPIYIYCHCNNEIILKRMKVKHEMLFLQKSINKAMQYFAEYFCKTPIKVISINTAIYSPQEAAKRVLSILK